MPEPSDAHFELSRRLLAHAGAGSAHATDAAEAAGRVYEALFRTLDPLIGVAGAHALFVRSLKLAWAAPDVPSEPSSSDPTVTAYLVGRLRELDQGEDSEAAARLFAVLLRLLTNFIGESLVWQILQKAFPGIDGIPPTEEVR
jgi:hypothetical protein